MRLQKGKISEEEEEEEEAAVISRLTTWSLSIARARVVAMFWESCDSSALISSSGRGVRCPSSVVTTS